MRYIKQFAIIILISLLGELLNKFLPFSVPASIYGLAIMLLTLMLGILKVEQVKDVSDFLLNIMPVLFVPASVGLMDVWGVMEENLVPLCAISIIGTCVVVIVTGLVTQKIGKMCSNNKDGEADKNA